MAAPFPAAAQDPAEPAHGLAMHGAPALSPDFPHLPYVNPDAPQGGRLVQAVLGTFDSLNPYVVRGTAPVGISGPVVESLMARSYDEPFTLYGLIAERVSVPDDRSSITFHLNPAARFSDGEPVTSEDVRFTWELLKEKGRPNHRTYYSKVRAVDVIDEHTIRFDLSGSGDRELPLILGLMAVLPAHIVNPETFGEGGLTPLVGSGPYMVGAVQPGESFSLVRNPDYWGRELPVMRGFHNFNEIRYDFYRDANTMFEAFKRGLFDVRIETDPTRWASGYDFPARQDGRVVQETFATQTPKGMNALVFNTRREIFSDVRVREALMRLFDFEWVNANLFGGLYARTGSFYHGSALSAFGTPADDRERAILAAHPDAVRADIMDGTWSPPVTDGSGRDRSVLRAALGLFREAGWTLSGGKLMHEASGTAMAFEILVRTKDQERIALAYASQLARAGISAQVRLADSVQFEQRMQTYDFDMAPYFWFASLSPGNEQAFYWGSAAADTPGTRNYMGAKNSAIDAAIAALVDAREREDLVAATRALDRVLMSGFYVIPLYHLPEQWMARWTHIARPQTTPLYGPALDTWWHGNADQARATPSPSPQTQARTP